MGTQNMERLQKLTERIEKAEEDFGNQADTLFVSLGLKKELPDSGMGTQNMERLQKLTERRVFFTLVGLDAVENEKSLEVKVAELKAEKGRVSAQLAAEKVKASKLDAGEEEERL
eukprot:g2560.t1